MWFIRWKGGKWGCDWIETSGNKSIMIIIVAYCTFCELLIPFAHWITWPALNHMQSKVWCTDRVLYLAPCIKGQNVPNLGSIRIGGCGSLYGTLIKMFYSAFKAAMLGSMSVGNVLWASLFCTSVAVRWLNWQFMNLSENSVSLAMRVAKLDS